MKKSNKKQLLRLSIVTAAIVFVVCVITIAAYAIITYDYTKDTLTNNEENEAAEFFNDIYDEISLQGSYDYLNYFINQYNSSDKYITIKNEYGITLAQSENIFCGTFVGNENSSDKIEYKYDEDSLYFGMANNAYIDFDSFRSSMTDAQYEKITQYLNDKPTDKELYYELVCTEFYVSNSVLIKPKTVEIVAARSANTWHIQDKHVESFELTPADTSGMKLYHISDTYRNIIDRDFVLNKYNYNWETLKQNVKLCQHKNVELMNTDKFTYTLVKKNSFYFYSENNKINFATAMYASQFNVLDECYENIIYTSVFILIFFIIICAVLEFSIIHTFRSRVKQEQKRIEMVNAFAHNMKTPIQVISGFAENLNRHIESESNQRYVSVIQNQALSMDKLVYRMLDYSRLDSEKIKLNKTYFNLDGLLNEVLAEHAPPTGKSFDIVIDGDAEIYADRELLSLALENLIENALKYSPDNSVIRIKISDGKFEITNPCESIMKSELKKLWQPYFRLNANSEKGNGLGLSIVSSVFKLHKFRFGANSANNSVTFFFKY